MKSLCTPYACAFCHHSFSAANALVSHVQTNHAMITTSEVRNDTSKDKFEGEMEEDKTKILARNQTGSGGKNYKDIDKKVNNEPTELEAKNENPKDENESETEKTLNDLSNIGDIEGFGMNSKNNKQVDYEADMKSTKSYKCKICDKACKSLRILYGHIDNNHREKKYSCKSCTQKFRYPSKLEIHERFHTGKKPYACRFCDKKFCLQQNKTEHERTHTGEKPYSCKYCDKKYAGHSNKNHHEFICKRKTTNQINLKLCF